MDPFLKQHYNSTTFINLFAGNGNSITRTHPLASPSLLSQRGGRFSNVIQWSPPSLRQQRRGPNVKKQPRRAVLVRSQPAGLQGDEYMKTRQRRLLTAQSVKNSIFV